MIYIHIPYCHRKCTYCAFYSAVTAADKQGYVEALCRELSDRRSEQSHPLTTVYLGGGTPSLLTPSQLGQIVDTLRQHYDTSQLREVTLEANPEDLTPEFLRQLAGLRFFNRVSIGVQSFSDADLRMLNRRHSAAQSVEAVRQVYAAGFHNISIDLIYGLPGQSLQGWEHNLAQLHGLPVTHLSAYALTVEEGTMLHRQIQQGQLAPADEAVVLSHYQALLATARLLGFEQYEVSNFALPGFRAQHNSRYWDRTPYLGAGAAAHSFDGHSRRWNVADAHRYIQSIMAGEPCYESETLTPADAHNEYLMTALRTREGIAKAHLADPYRAHLAHAIQPYIANHLIHETPTHYRPTPEGLLHADGIAAALFVG